MKKRIFNKFQPYLNEFEKEKIALVEEKITGDNERIANDVSVDLIIILESKMMSILEKYDIYCPLDERGAKNLFDKIRSLYIREKKLESEKFTNVNIPKIIYSTFEYIRNWRNNDGGHASEFVINRSFMDTIHLLKCFDIVLSFLINFFDDLDFEINEFDEKGLLSSWNKRGHFIDEILEEDKKLDTTSIKLGKINLSSFVLNSEISFFIPSYQRKYRWESETCLELIENIISKIDQIDDEYFGTIAVTIEESKHNEKIRTIRLIDGQQRVTTSLIIFRAIYDVWNDKKNNSYEETVMDTPLELEKTFKEIGCAEKYKNVTGVKEENEALNFILNSNVSYVERLKTINSFELHNKSLAAKNYNAIHDRIKELNQDELLSFYNRYAYKFLISCVDFNKTPAEEMEIFETLNSKGTELDSFDMIKNFLFNLVDKEIYINNELEITRIFNDYISFNDMKLDEAKTRKVQENFLFGFCEYKMLNFKASDNTLSKNKKSILKHFKKIYEGKQNLSLEEYKKIVSEIGKYVFITKSFISKSYENDTNDILYPIRYNVSNISHKEVSIFILYYFIDLYAKNNWDSYNKTLNYSEKVNLMKDTLFEFERWLIALLQVYGTGQSLTKPILRLFRFLNTFDIDNHSVQSEIPNMIRKWLNLEATDAFAFLNNDQRRLLLENNELKMPNKDLFFENLINKKVQDKNVAMVILKRLESFLINNWEIKRDKNSLEHIMPRTIKKTKWIEYLKENESLTEKDILEKHSVYLDKLGNYMILDKSKENSKISNNDFEEKRKQYILWSNPLAELIFDYNEKKNLNNINKFGFDEIQERTVALAKIISENIYYK
ncbi:unknown protein [Mesoplasma florum L1]|uniref:DUF262 domain-containing protein n=1 Tax=Mesoplasma florum (strain ATCC 33453 / NBRC 100688 / NCTC 11704 / L1) TaxID=265311 RepID=Q6F1G1_MESFL|nr:DUF262 domain-containing protein [Mesoplasma florum]AAT75662.1 unknown protein [Mesoplasma florum L1]